MPSTDIHRPAHPRALDDITAARGWARSTLDAVGTRSTDHDTPSRARGDLRSDRYRALVERGAVSAATLARAHTIQRRAGGTLLSILTSWPEVDADAVATALAREHGLARVELHGRHIEPRHVARLDPRTAARHLFVPIGDGPLGTTVAINDPTDPQLRRRVAVEIGGPVELVVATAGEISEALNAVYGRQVTHQAIEGLREERPEDSAATVLTAPQRLVLFAGLVLTAVALAAAPIPTLWVLNGGCAILYLAAALFRVRLIDLAGRTAGDPGADALAGPRPEELDESDLPIYTVLVPLYREAAVVEQVVASLGRLDYPAHKLDVLLICEAEDDETVPAIRAMGLGEQFRLIIVPDSKPKTKPKACNYALEYARGEFAVIFDAEDDPEPDQLRRVLARFATAGDDVACIQARLVYANAEQNLLTRWFAAEYAMWFDLVLPGLEALDVPIPLGGTSNHFRTAVLRELHGWDPYNVTEDADLGIRLYKRGYRTLTIDSRTFEEANSQVLNWIRQRSRWMKGHLQTWLVHNRNPVGTLRALGWRGWLAFQLTIGASVGAALLNPVFWGLLVLWFATHLQLLRRTLPEPVYLLASINLLVWNFAFMYANGVAVARRNATYLVRSVIILPLYWVLISIATWKGTIQLITNPFYWEKTVHGLGVPDRPEAETP